MIKLRKKNSAVDTSENLLNNLSDLQNEVNAFYGFKTISIINVGSDKKALDFAIWFAKSFEKNDFKTLIIDCNFYNHNLFERYSVTEKENVVLCNQNVSVYIPKDEIYPSEFFKREELKKIIKNNEKEFSHFLVLSPDIRTHKDFLYPSDAINCSLLVVEKNVTTKSDIFYATNLLEEKGLKLAKVIILS